MNRARWPTMQISFGYVLNIHHPSLSFFFFYSVVERNGVSQGLLVLVFMNSLQKQEFRTCCASFRLLAKGNQSSEQSMLRFSIYWLWKQEFRTSGDYFCQFIDDSFEHSVLFCLIKWVMEMGVQNIQCCFVFLFFLFNHLAVKKSS